MIKKKLLILFGGISVEHDISQLSVKNVIANIDTELFDIHIIGITKKGRWIYVNNVREIENSSWIYGDKNAYILPDAEKSSIIILNDEDKEVDSIKIDVCFPVLHGQNGEDGTIQGLLELARIPYVGCGVLSSAVCLDKISTKMIVDRLGINQVKYISIVDKNIDYDKLNKDIIDTMGYPVFVKPSNGGSSVGITKVASKEGLEDAILQARKCDKRIVIEQAINAREIECAIFKGDRTIALGLGEILPDGDFYDFDAKYNKPSSQTIVNPNLSKEIVEKIKDSAIKIFDGLSCESLSRVDFFLDNGSNEIYFNEINTMPGFTNISMYPMIAKEYGMDEKELVSQLILNAIKRK